jgi:hypothetical protein
VTSSGLQALSLGAALFFGALLGGCQSESMGGSGALAASEMQVRIGGVDWYVDYEVALAQARAVGKPLWVHFGENPG